MATSSLINDFISGNISLETTFRKLHVILASLKNDELIDWVKNELSGYNDVNKLPPYRIITGRIYGTYTEQVGFKLINHNDVPLATTKLKKETIDNICTMKLRHSICQLIDVIEQDDGLSYTFSPEYYQCFEMPETRTLSAYVKCDKNQLLNIISTIKTKITDILISLEENFGNLDDLDINCDIRNKQEIKNLINRITVIIYQDNSIRIGDKNKILKSNIFSGIKFLKKKS